MFNNSVVIDDRHEDGYAICNTLSSKGYSSLFVHYTEDSLIQHNKVGVRFVFLDLSLSSSGVMAPCTTDYDIASSLINLTLSSENGPWVLIVWSTWADDETNYSQEAFDHICREIREVKKIQPPISFFSLPKEEGLLSSGNHSELKALNSGDMNNIFSSLLSKLDDYPAFKSLVRWESEIFKSSSSLLDDLTLAFSGKDHELVDVLHHIGLAEAGEKDKDNDNELAIAAAKVLNRILTHKITHNSSLAVEAIQKKEKEPDSEVPNQSELKRRLNFILHIENRKYSSNGAVYAVNREVISHIIGKKIRSRKCYATIVNRLKKEHLPDELDSAKGNVESTDLIIVDITPSCDHANKKAYWRKYLVGVLVKVQSSVVNDQKALSKLMNHIKKNANCWIGPVFSSSQETGSESYEFLYISLKSIFSIPEGSNSIETMNSMYVLRESTLKELVSKFTHHISRPGIVDVAR